MKLIIAVLILVLISGCSVRQFFGVPARLEPKGYNNIQEKMPLMKMGGRVLHSSSKEKECLEEVADALKKICSDAEFGIKPFFVEIERFDSITGGVLQWKKTAGFSLWSSSNKPCPF